eukprot:g22960.t1
MDFKKIDYKDQPDLIAKLQPLTKSKSNALIVQLVNLIVQHGNSKSNLKKNLTWTMGAIEHIENVNTKDAYLTKLRKAFKAHHEKEEKQINKALSLTEEERTKKATTQIKKRNANLKNIKDFEPELVMRVMDTLNESNKLVDMIILLQLATGRRLIEVLRITDLPQEAKQPHYIIIDKVAKDKKGHIKDIEVPLIHISYDDMKTAWQAVRDGLSESDKAKSNEDLTNKFNARVSKRMTDLFERPMTSHMSRKIYGAMAYREYAPANIDRSVYLSGVLGHVEDSEASRYYANVKVRPPEIATEPQARQAIDKLENKIDRLEDKIEGLNANLPPDVIDALAIIQAMKKQGLPTSNKKIREFARVGSVKAKFINDIAREMDDEEAKVIEAKVMRSKKANTMGDIEAEILLLNGKREATKKKIEALQKKKAKIEIQQQAWEKRKQQAQQKIEDDKYDEEQNQKKIKIDREFKKYFQWIKNKGARGLTAKTETLDKMDKLLRAGNSFDNVLQLVLK